MHHTRRLLIVIPALMVLLPMVPLKMTGLLSMDERDRAKESLNMAIGDAASEYRMRGGLQSRLEKGNSALTKQAVALKEAEHVKFLARQEVIRLRRIRDKVQTRTGTELPTKEEAVRLLDIARARLTSLLRQRSDARGTILGLGRWMGGLQWGTGDERLLRYQQSLVKDLTAAVSVLDRLEKAEAQRETALKLYADASHDYDETAGFVRVSEAQLAENRRIMSEVHEHVLSLQGELARIDARLRLKAGRALVEKGLLDADDVRHAAAAEKPTFSWPVYGRVSAGFKNAAYVLHFGVQHYGADLVVPQGTPVGAAADGVVFLVRDGGLTGYTYILIGHQDGYATLYGHLNETSVQSGQLVTAGQMIGLSGGKPGTHGAGPMTTAAHLHFEVILNGVNIDPLSVLP